MVISKREWVINQKNVEQKNILAEAPDCCANCIHLKNEIWNNTLNRRFWRTDVIGFFWPKICFNQFNYPEFDEKNWKYSCKLMHMTYDKVTKKAI